MAGELVNVATSKIAPKERYLKMYREIHNLYLRTDFTNLQDFNQAMTELNARFTELETKITTELATLQIGLATHTHPVTTVGGPTNQAGIAAPPTAPPYRSAFSVTKPVIAKTTFAEQNNTILQATGPAISPLGNGIA